MIRRCAARTRRSITRIPPTRAPPTSGFFVGSVLFAEERVQIGELFGLQKRRVRDVERVGVSVELGPCRRRVVGRRDDPLRREWPTRARSWCVSGTARAPLLEFVHFGL